MARKTKQPAAMPAERLDAEIDRLAGFGIDDLRSEWKKMQGTAPPPGLTKDLMARALTYRLQEQAFGDLRPATRRLMRDLGKPGVERQRHVKVGSVIVREYGGALHEVLFVPGGFCWQGQIFDSLSTIAKRITGTNWNGPRFFGLRGRAGVSREPDRLLEVKAASGLLKAPRGRRSSVGRRLPRTASLDQSSIVP